MTNLNTIKALYLHVPFCKTICAYCDFCHVIYQDNIVDKWLHNIALELAELDLNDLSTIYIGGGTPTSLSNDQLNQLLSLLSPYANNIDEYTVEVNPETMNDDKYYILQKYGVNRISMGLQSTNDRLLKMMNRKHSFNDVKHVINKFKEVGIDNISLDLMYSLPTQTIAEFKESIELACSLDIKHISLYSLTIEENTIFKRLGYESLDDDTEADMYEMACALLPSLGFKQYEISNFGKLGYESKHNQAYWNYDNFYGVGCGASGKENNIRYDNVDNVYQYVKDYHQRSIIELSEEDMMFENIMMSLRMVKGLDIDVFNRRYNTDFLKRYEGVIAKMVDAGLVIVDEGYLRCSDYGLRIANTVIEEFMDS